jgi:hypothetical protein
MRAASRRKDDGIHDGGHGKSLDHVERIESSMVQTEAEMADAMHAFISSTACFNPTNTARLTML